MRLSRRQALALPAALSAGRLTTHDTSRRSSRTISVQSPISVTVAAHAEDEITLDTRELGVVGAYDVDWLTEPGYGRLLDNLAASPGAFHGVRFFGAFTAGTRERISPETQGSIWPDRDQPPDFTATFAGLEALTSRGLVPFVVLGFFPAAVSDSPTTPPATWDHWQTLVRSFFEELAADGRFGPEAISSWWFEVWNEPNEGRFWSGTQDDFLGLYRATSEAVVTTGLPIRLGGPAIAYKPKAGPEFGPPWLERFLRFVADDPGRKLDFLSIHRKGTVTADPPDPRRLWTAANDVANLALTIDAGRFAGEHSLTIVNNEADEKVGFEVPYAPRVDHRNASWLAASTAIQTALNERHQEDRTRFIAAADNINLHLVDAPFDGRRSLMTRAAPGSITDLLKVPAYGFYELLRLLGERVLPVVSGSAHLFPDTDLYHLATAGEDRIAVLLTYYPDPALVDPAPQTVAYDLRGIPWPKVNVALFRIDATLSNSHTAAGGSAAIPHPLPDPARLPAIRREQEITVARPLARGVPIDDGTYRETVALDPYATVCLWITPARDDIPAAPRWLDTTVEGGNVVLRWSPNSEPWFFSHELYLRTDGVPGERLSPDPLRAALWVDTNPPPGDRVYGVRTVSASGVASEIAWAPAVLVPED